jgi:phosphoserine aminotransferase
MKPSHRPARPYFSSGPCAKRPGWSAGKLEWALTGRSHRSAAGKARLKEVLERSRKILGVPQDYRMAVVPASDTGAVEIAMWNLLGPRPVDMVAFDSFGQDWVTDVLRQLRLDDVHVLEAPYGELPDLSRVDPAHDLVFTWNGTTSGVRVPGGDWIAADRQGLSLCDATSAVFAMRVPWDKLDVVTWSWQKVLGGEAQHGILVLSPRAVARLEDHTPSWPLPKLFRLTKGGRLNEAIFRGETINTPSMLCVEDAIDALKWAESIGGLSTLVGRTETNAAALARWVECTPWVDFLARDVEIRSTTSVCLKVVDPGFTALADDAQRALIKTMTERLEAEMVAFDIAGYRAAPPGLRVWCGATVETTDIESLTPWLDWAYEQVRSRVTAAA